MAKFEQASKLQGISEQADVKASVLTAKDINGLYPDETVGLVRCTPFKRLHTILNADPTITRKDFISPLTGKATRLTISPSSVSVLDLENDTAVPSTLDPDCLTYLNTAGELYTRVIGDNFAAVNKDVKVLEVNTNPVVTEQPPLVFFKSLTLGINYSIRKLSPTSTVASYTVPTTGSTTYQNDVAEELATQLRTNEGWTVDVTGGVMRIITNGEDIDVVSSSQRHLEDVVVIKGKTDLLSNVPSVGFDGYVIEVTGSVSDDARQFIKFEADNGVRGSGKWVESVKPEDETDFDATTLPVFVVPNVDTNGFDIIPMPVTGRKVGDAKLNPSPSFVNNYIRDLEEHKSRLGILSNRAVSLSDSGDPYNFYRDTITTLDESQRIDLDIPTKSLAESGLYLVSFQDDLLIFTGSSYISLYSSNDGILKPDDATTSRQGTLQTSKFVKPKVGTSAVFALAAGESQVNLYEIFRREVGIYGINNTSTATPSLISKDASKMVSTPNYSSAYILNKDNELIIHKYLIDGDKKVQQAFVRRTTPFTKIENIIEDELNSRLIVSGFIGNDYVTATMSLDVKAFLHDDLMFNVYLDDQILLTDPEEVENTNTFNLEHRYVRPPELTDEWLSSEYYSIGYKLGTNILEDENVTITEDYVYTSTTTDKLIFGKSFESSIELHQIYAPSEGENKNPNPVLIKQLVAEVVDSSSIVLKLTNKQTNQSVEKVRGNIKLQQTSAELGTIVPTDTFYRFLRLGYSKTAKIELKSNIWLPLTILSFYIDAEEYSVNNVFVY